MSTTVEPYSKNQPVLGSEPDLPDAGVLEDKTPEWLRTSPRVAVFVTVLGLLMVTLFASRPLWPTDLWDHVNYGNWILRHGAVPDSEPLLPLAEGVPMVNTSWFAQTGLAALFSWQGFAGLQFVYGLLVILPLGIVAWGGVRRTGSSAAGFLALLSFLALNWQQFLVIRPQLVGVVCFTALVTWLLTQYRPGYGALAGWPVCFLVWANCHGSFAIGLAVLALAAVGHFAELIIRTRRLTVAASSRRFVFLILITQLSAVAALVNPDGLAIFAEVIRVGRHENVASMFEWDPLTLRMHQGQVAAVLCGLLVPVLRWSPRRLRLDEMILLTFTGVMTLWSARMINWLAPILALTLATHGTAALRAWRRMHRPNVQRRRSGLWTLVSTGLCWIFFAFTTLGIQVIHGRTLEMRRAVSVQTPVAAVEFLDSRESLPGGIAFCSAEWTGFLQTFGPSELHPMVNLHVHLIPEEVWSHYLSIIAGSAGWDGLMEQYGINLAITDQMRHERLIREIRESGEWEQLYADSQTVIFQRIDSI